VGIRPRKKKKGGGGSSVGKMGSGGRYMGLTKKESLTGEEEVGQQGVITQSKMGITGLVDSTCFTNFLGGPEASLNQKACLRGVR